MSKRRFVVLALLILVLMLVALVAAGCGSDKDSTKAPYTTLDVQQAYDRLSQNNSAILVDVRNPEEWAATGIAPGSTLISLPEFDQRAPAELPKDQEIFVICNSGNRSRVAAQSLIDQGYKHVFNIDGGIQAWLAAGLPTEPYTP